MNRAMMRAARSNGRRMTKQGWNAFSDVTDDALKRHEILNPNAKSRFPDQVFLNNVYSVQVFNHTCEWGSVKKAMIRRNDERPEHNWLMIQRIKNEIFGEHTIALEVYPRQVNLVDVANMYWIWILPPEFHCPIEMTQTSNLAYSRQPKNAVAIGGALQ